MASPRDQASDAASPGAEPRGVRLGASGGVIDRAVRVRRAGRNDAPAIALVLQVAFAEYKSLYTRAAFAATTPAAEEIARRLGEGPTWIALLHRAVVGTVSAVSRGEALYVRSMAVVPDLRGRGVGRLLLEQVERYAGEQGFRWRELSTTDRKSGA